MLRRIRYKGRKPIEAKRRESVLRLAAEGATRTRIAAELGLGEATVYRILARQKTPGPQPTPARPPTS